MYGTPGQSLVLLKSNSKTCGNVKYDLNNKLTYLELFVPHPLKVMLLTCIAVYVFQIMKTQYFMIIFALHAFYHYLIMPTR